MAFNRKIELSVGSDGTGLLISDLHVEFNVERSLTFEENTAEFMIYNAKESTRKEVLREGNNLIFKMGYEDEAIGTIFIGNITESRSVNPGPDWITTVQASSILSSKKALENVYVSLSYSEDTLLSQPLKAIGTALGMAVFGEENARLTLDNGFTYTGTARGALNYCKNILEASGVGVYIDNTEIVVFRIGEKPSRFTPVYLDYESGLLMVEDITEYDNQSKKNPKRISFESIIVPKLQPNGLVTIGSGNPQGTFIIERVNFSGDNFGGDNRCVAEATE